MMQKVIFGSYNNQHVYKFKIDGVLYADTNGNQLVVVHVSKEKINPFAKNRWLAVDSKTGLYVFAESTKKKLIEFVSTNGQNRLQRYIEFLHTDKYQETLIDCKKILDGDSNDI